MPGLPGIDVPRTLAGTRTVIPSSRTAAGARTVIGTATKASHAIAEPSPSEAFESGWAYLSGGGTVTNNDATHFKTGTGAVKLVCDNVTVGSGNLFAEKTVSLNFSTLKVASVSMWVYLDFTGDHTTTQCYCNFFFSSDGFSTSLSGSTTYMSLSPGWNLVTWDRTQITGSGSWTATHTKMRLKVGAVASQTVTCWVDSLIFNYYARPFVIIDFDDAFDTVHSAAYPILSAAGLLANLYLVSSFLDDASGHITTAHAQALYDAGWDICNHTSLHNNLKAETTVNITTQLNDCDTVLRANGWTRAIKHGAWPNGGTGANTDAGSAAAGMLTMRGTQNALNVPPVIDNAYKLACHSVNGLTENANTVLALVDAAIAGGYSVRLLFHSIIAGAPSVASEYQTSVFQTVITGVANRIRGGRLGNATWSEYYTMTQGGGRVKLR